MDYSELQNLKSLNDQKLKLLSKYAHSVMCTWWYIEHKAEETLEIEHHIAVATDVLEEQGYDAFIEFLYSYKENPNVPDSA